MAIRVVCFDLGGVLVKICRSVAEAAALAALPAPDPERWQHVDSARRRSDVVRRYHNGDLSCEAYYAELAAASAEQYTLDQARELHRVWLMGEYPGVDQLISELNAIPGLRTACLSNTAHAHWHVMTESQAQRFPAVNQLQVKRASHLMRRVKPDLDIYEQAIADLQVAPHEILFFDDLAENIAGARAAGMCAEQINPEIGTEPQLRAHLRAWQIPV
jgi:glucose-1-phosphatase